MPEYGFFGIPHIYVKKLDINAERVTFETSFRAYFDCF
jgi:hypothetical protein